MIIKSNGSVTPSGEMLSNKPHLVISVCLLVFLCLFNISQAIAAPLVFDDGGIHNVDGVVGDGISISSGSTLNVKNGAVISASAELDGEAIRTKSSATIKVQGGTVDGKVSFSDLSMMGGKIKGAVGNSNTPFGDFIMSSGEIDGKLNMFGGNAEISGGVISSIFSETAAHLNISGGAFGNVETISGTYDISGGSFTGELEIVGGGEAVMNITGGKFFGGFSYGPSFVGPATSFIFTGFDDLSLSTPIAGASGAEARISGTLLDGSSIDQTITCGDSACGGVNIIVVNPGEVSFERAEYEISENGSGITLKVDRVNGSDGEISVDFASIDGSAKATTDYEVISGTLTFAAGVTSGTISVHILDDGDFEGDEDFEVVLSGITGGAKLGSNSSAKINIEEDDLAPPAGVFMFSEEGYDAVEGGSNVTVTVKRVDGDFGAVSVDFSTADGTAVAGSDYQFANDTLTFAEGETSKNINVIITNDSIFEGDEAFAIELSNAKGGAELDTVTSATINIEDDDPAPSAGVLQFGEAGYSVNENTASLEITITREDGSTGDVTVGFNMVAGTATADEDYVSQNGVITLAAGETKRTIIVTIIDDDSFEGNESFSMTLSNPQGDATLGSISNAEIVIEEDDPAPTAGVLRFSGENYDADEGDAGVTITIQRVSGSFGEVSVELNTVDVTAIAGMNYQLVSKTLTFVDGELSKMIDVPLIDDMSFDGDKTFSVVLSNATGGVTLDVVSSAEVIIKEDEQAPQAGVLQFSEAIYNVPEDDGSVVVRVTRENGNAGAVSVSYKTADGVAVAGVDYQAVDGILTFADGQTSRTVVVTILNDNNFEGNKSLTMTLSNIQDGAVLGTLETTTITINEDDPNPDEGNVTTDANTVDASDSGDDEPASTGSGVTGTSAISPLSLLLLMAFLAFFSNRLRKL